MNSIDERQTQIDRERPGESSRPDLIRRAQRIGNRFQNPVPTSVGGLRTMLKVLPRFLRKRPETVPRRQLGPFQTDPAVYHSAPSSGVRVTWMGHSSMLLELDSARILIDPVWEQRASPIQHWGPKRFFDPPLPLEHLPPLDAVLISHNHYDHLGAETIRKLARLPQTAKAHWVTSLGVGPIIRQLGVRATQLRELNWTDVTRTEPVNGEPIQITAWPARHFSARGLRDRNRTLWSSFSLRGSDHSVFFGADSGYWEGFSAIAEAAGGFDLTMLEIGAFDELWADIHLGPDNAIRAFREMDAGLSRAGLLMPIHWGLFDLALHAWDQPIEKLVELSRPAGVPLWTPVPGKPTVCVPGQELFDPWWRQSPSSGGSHSGTAGLSRS